MARKTCNITLVIITMCSILFFNSCKKSIRTEHLKGIAKEFIGKSIILPENLYDDFTAYNFRNFIFISYIDSVECTRCVLEKIKQYMVHDFSKVLTDNLIIINNFDEERVRKILSELYIDYPVLFDKTGEFKKKNYFLTEDFFKYFVIDKRKKIIWLGSPIETSKSWMLYNKLIRKSTKNI